MARPIASPARAYTSRAPGSPRWARSTASAASATGRPVASRDRGGRSRRPPRSPRRTRGCRSGTAAPRVDGHVPDLAGHAVRARDDPAVHHQAAADARADRHHGEVGEADARAEPLLGDGQGPDVVVDGDRQSGRRSPRVRRAGRRASPGRASSAPLRRRGPRRRRRRGRSRWTSHAEPVRLGEQFLHQGGDRGEHGAGSRSVTGVRAGPSGSGSTGPPVRR